MKKVLVLMLVLGMASMASAGLTWSQSSITLTVGEVGTVQLVSSDGAMGKVWTIADLGVAGLAVSPLANAGDDASAAVYDTSPASSYYGWAYAEILDSAAPFNNAPGNVFDVTLTGAAEGMFTMTSDYYSSLGAGDSLMVTVIPEPMTIGLLGLGGLFLRRRK